MTTYTYTHVTEEVTTAMATILTTIRSFSSEVELTSSREGITKEALYVYTLSITSLAIAPVGLQTGSENITTAKDHQLSLNEVVIGSVVGKLYSCSLNLYEYLI